MVHNSNRMGRGKISKTFLLVSIYFIAVSLLFAGDPFSVDQLMSTKYVTGADMSPYGQWVAFTKSVPRTASDKPGGSYAELWLQNVKTKELKPFITGKVNVRGVQWKPDGSAVSFLARRDDDKNTQVYEISISGGEAKAVTDAENSISSYEWAADGKSIFYTSSEPKTKREMALEKAGYDFIYYEEDWTPINLYRWDVVAGKSEQITKGTSVASFKLHSSGKIAAVATMEKNLIDYRYAFQKISVLDLATKELDEVVSESRKFGNYEISPDGKNLVLAAALNKNDNQISQAFVYDITTGKETNLTPASFRGHVSWVAWKDNSTILFMADEDVNTSLNEKSIVKGERKVLLNTDKTGMVFRAPSFAKDGKTFALVGETPTQPSETYCGSLGKNPIRYTFSNPELDKVDFGAQTVITYTARDGWKVEGLLIKPVDYVAGKSYPLVVLVHGGPEAHNNNGWLSRYSTPGQVLAGKGYVVFYPNYRASTGYGVDFAMAGFGDAAGKEFDDIADGIDFLVDTGIADKQRVGLGGGSYGGYASAWFATYYTEKVRAVCMFVGISDLISKRGTTDIPYEELFVHSGKKLEDMWDQSLKRSPIYYAHQSKTATLIYGGAADTRVHPSQSIELYRRMKMNDHPAVRLVQYPGEGHGNRRQTGQIDVIYRILDWYDWYVKDLKPLDGDMPPLDISDKYGIKLPN